MELFAVEEKNAEHSENESKRLTETPLMLAMLTATTGQHLSVMLAATLRSPLGVAELATGVSVPILLTDVRPARS